MVGPLEEVVSSFRLTSQGPGPHRGGETLVQSSEELALLRLNLLWTIPTSLSRSQSSLVLLLNQYKTEEEFFLQRLQTPSAGSDSPPPGLSYIRASRRAIFDTTSNIFDLWSRPWGVARLFGLLGVPPRYHLSEGVG